MRKKQERKVGRNYTADNMGQLLRLLGQDPIDAAIEKVTEFPAKCPGPCFPLVGRPWMSHPAFLDA